MNKQLHSILSRDYRFSPESRNAFRFFDIVIRFFEHPRPDTPIFQYHRRFFKPRSNLNLSPVTPTCYTNGPAQNGVVRIARYERYGHGKIISTKYIPSLPKNITREFIARGRPKFYGVVGPETFKRVVSWVSRESSCRRKYASNYFIRPTRSFFLLHPANKRIEIFLPACWIRAFFAYMFLIFLFLSISLSISLSVSISGDDIFAPVR